MMSRTYVSIVITPIVILLLSSVFLVFPFTKHSVTQPLAFDHKIHIENAGLSCKECHLNEEQMGVFTIPTLEICQMCHAGEPISKSPAEKDLLKYIAEKKEIPWIKVYEVPEHVYFSHRRHVTIGELECSSCHGNVAAMTTPVSNQTIPVTMENCVSCHKQRKVTNDCLACHR